MPAPVANTVSSGAGHIVIFGSNGQLARELRRVFPHAAACGRDLCDLSDAAQIEQTLDREQPDILINAAAYTAVDAAESEPTKARLINTVAPGVLAHYAAQRRIPLVHFSTDYVFDGRNAGWYVETDKPAPLSVYGATKLAGEDVVIATCARAGNPYFILRTSWLYGPTTGEKGNFIKTMLHLARNRDALSVVADQHGVPTSARWLAEITRQILESSKPVAAGIYHAVPSGETTWHGLACFTIAEARRLGVPIKVRQEAIAPIPLSQYPHPAARPVNCRLDHSKLRAALGNLPIPPWQEQVAAYVAEQMRNTAAT